MRCTECGFNSHEKCMECVPKNCHKVHHTMSDTTSMANVSLRSFVDTPSASAGNRRET